MQLKNPPRLFGWLVATLALAAAILFFAPQQLPVSVYKLSLVSMAGVAGYWLDRSLFPYARPDQFVQAEVGADFDLSDKTDLATVAWQLVPNVVAFLFAAAMLRRALVVGATMLAIGLGA